MKPTNHNAAAACQEMGLSIGDTIIGREGGPDWWSESALTLLWLGEETAVFREAIRTDRDPEWRLFESETASWHLNYRDWRRAKPGEVTA